MLRMQSQMTSRNRTNDLCDRLFYLYSYLAADLTAIHIESKVTLKDALMFRSYSQGECPRLKLDQSAIGFGDDAIATLQSAIQPGMPGNKLAVRYQFPAELDGLYMHSGADA
jgi:hypothetical protein